MERTSVKTDKRAPHVENMLKNVQGTFSAEGLTLNETCLANLSRIANGNISYQQVLTELKTKYTSWG